MGKYLIKLGGQSAICILQAQPGEAASAPPAGRSDTVDGPTEADQPN